MQLRQVTHSSPGRYDGRLQDLGHLLKNLRLGMFSKTPAALKTIVISVVVLVCAILALIGGQILYATVQSNVHKSRTAVEASGPQLITSATIGGTQASFVATYGASTFGSIAQYELFRPNGESILICWCATRSGTDGQPRVATLGLEPTNSTGWNQTMATSMSKPFMPPDAIYERTLQTQDVGAIDIYRSADLAKTFPVSDFYDGGNNNAPLPPGTFSVACNLNIAGCTIVIGT